MAINKITLKQFNGTDYDILYPKTVADQVVESTSKRFVTDAEKTKWNGKQDALGFTPENVAKKGVANGYAALDASGKVPQAQLPTVVIPVTTVNGLTGDVVLNHTHVGAIAATEKGKANGVATLGGNGKLLESQLPAIAITDTYVVDNEAGMLALDAQKGDVAIRKDLNKSFILKGTDPATKGDWEELRTPTDAVLSVNGKVGAVTLNAAEVGALALTDVVTTATANKVLKLDGSGKLPASITGTATGLATARTIALTGAVTGSATFDGTANASIAATLKNSGVTAGTYSKVTVDAKGIVTSATNLTREELGVQKITVSATAPAGAIAGDFWYEIG